MEKKENKTMKKGLTIAALALLLGIVGYTGGNTFAKYITQESVPSTSATVAQWGYTITVGADNLWGTDYVYNAQKSASIKTTEDGVTVDAANTAVAPGTTGSTTLSIQGQTEVLSQLQVTAAVKDIVLKDSSNAEVYKPLKWTISGTAKIGEEVILNNESVSKDAAGVALFLNDLAQTRILPKTNININLTITWAWAFEQGDSDDKKALNNKYDTYLGLLAAGKDADGYKASAEDLKTSYSLSVKLVQLDQ